eukprot:TRINITY_DN678_c0_g2_i4.p1 TRINITY_DN678_c0_g2~~TRINITY_DN678_c0_g2_i4.p1  ORF type:complete len:159 (-),score=33.73 TRINITY_DN678_c0_g2_i4:80-556(-)
MSRCALFVFGLVLLLGAANVEAICRSEVIARAKTWVAAHVPYSQTNTYQGYRTDCSGYVSMTWEEAKPGYTTSEFLPDGVAHSITKADLLPGDIMLAPGHHVCLFGGWSNSSQVSYVSYEECSHTGCQGTVTRIIPYPYTDYPGATFAPARYKNIQNC